MLHETLKRVTKPNKKINFPPRFVFEGVETNHRGKCPLSNRLHSSFVLDHADCVVTSAIVFENVVECYKTGCSSMLSRKASLYQALKLKGFLFVELARVTC